jgi:hypothetical protein
MTLKIINGGSYEGCEVEPGLGEEAVQETGPVPHPFEPCLDQCGELADVAFGQVGQGPLEVRPDRLDRVELGALMAGAGRRSASPGRRSVPGHRALRKWWSAAPTSGCPSLWRNTSAAGNRPE